MTNSHNVNSNNRIDISKIKSGIKASDLNLEGETLSLFNQADKNKNGRLDSSEVSLFNNSAKNYNEKLASTSQTSRKSLFQNFSFSEKDFLFDQASKSYLRSGIVKSEKIAFERMSKEEKIAFLRQKGLYRENTPCPSDNTRVETHNIRMAKTKVRIAQEQAHTKKVEAVEKELAVAFTPEQKKTMRTVVSRMQSDYKEAKASFDNQMKKDGWAADTADAIAHIWNNDVICITGNTASMVRGDLAIYQRQTKALKDGIQDGSFDRKFKNTFGVQYNPTNIKKYEKVKNEYEQLFAQSHAYDAFTTTLKPNIDEIKKLEKQLQLENNARARGQSGYELSNTETYLNRAKAAFICKMQDISGIKRKELEVPDVRLYGEYMKLYNDVSASLLQTKEKTTPQLSAKSEQVTQARKRAYGTSNNIIARVENYNSSQDSGATCVKFVAGVALNALGPTSVLGSLVYGAATSVAMDVADASTNGIDGDFDIKKTALNATFGGIFGATNQAIVNKFAGSVSSSILGSATGKTVAKNVGTRLTGFVVKEIISKEGVKLPAYGAEEITKSVVRSMAGVQTTEDGTGLSQKENEKAMGVVSEAMVYLAAARDNGKLPQNTSQSEMISLLNEHITTSLKDDVQFNKWLTQNNQKFQQMLNHIVQQELPKTNGHLKVSEKN